MKYTNSLINSTSPYLLQHAHNPVNWEPWSEEVIFEAKRANKLIIISIGYSACHWCHVMEHESFENEEVAEIMNRLFVCIKVDREERPDVDNYYMSAVQLMGQQGGWPLNVIALPDGRPIWGGTYFTKEIWMKNILVVAEFYQKNKEQTEKYADDLQNGIRQMLLVSEQEMVIPAHINLLKNGVANWKPKFDMKNGGRTGHPKFPMPVNLEFLLNYGILLKEKKTLDFVELTLLNMARGGIYDQIGGGFARYSVDEVWTVPHFEKMLYDNGQLLSVYSKAYQHFKNEEFKTVVFETVNFLEREMLDKSGAFYSALDADSEGEEGKFYVWSSNELREILADDFSLFSDYYAVNKEGFWELGNNILLRTQSNQTFSEKHKLPKSELQQKVNQWKEKLLKAREKRIRPGLDDKSLTSWNALATQGLCDAFNAFQENGFLKLAEKNAGFILQNLVSKSGKLLHTWKNGTGKIDGFLEDYALVMQALISLFEISGHEKWAISAKTICRYTCSNFLEKDKNLFYFSEKSSNSLLINHFQTEDNVIPSSNSVMANNLFKLHLIFGETEYLNLSKKMLHHITPQFTNYPMAYANWGKLMLHTTLPFFEVVFAGDKAAENLAGLHNNFHPNVFATWVKTHSEVPILKHRLTTGKSKIFVCQNGVCDNPVTTLNEVYNRINT